MSKMSKMSNIGTGVLVSIPDLVAILAAHPTEKLEAR
jgi:hypothetical protein